MNRLLILAACLGLVGCQAAYAASTNWVGAYVNETNGQTLPLALEGRLQGMTNQTAAAYSLAATAYSTATGASATASTAYSTATNALAIANAAGEGSETLWVAASNSVWYRGDSVTNAVDATARADALGAWATASNALPASATNGWEVGSHSALASTSYVANALSSYLPLAGGTMAGAINMDDHDIEGVDELKVVEIKPQGADSGHRIYPYGGIVSGQWQYDSNIVITGGGIIGTNQNTDYAVRMRGGRYWLQDSQWFAWDDDAGRTKKAFSNNSFNVRAEGGFYLTGPLYLTDTNNTKKFYIDEDGRAVGDGGGLSNVIASVTSGVSTVNGLDGAVVLAGAGINQITTNESTLTITATEADSVFISWRTNVAANTTNAIKPDGSLVDISSLLGGGITAETATNIAEAVVGGWVFDGFHVATPAIVTDGAAYLWAESNAWWTLDVTGANTLTAAVPWVISTNGLAVGEIPALAVKVALADSETNTWSWGSILTNSVTTPTAGSTNLFMLWWNGAAWVAY